MARLVVRAVPGARSEGFCGWFGDLPKFAVRAPAVDGAANDALERALARSFGLRRRAVRLVGGAASRTKRFEIDELEVGDVDRLIAVMNPR